MRLKIFVVLFSIYWFNISSLCALDQENFQYILEDTIKRSDSVVVGKIDKYSDTMLWDAEAESGVMGVMEVQVDEVIKGPLNKNDKILAFYQNRPEFKLGDCVILFVKGSTSVDSANINKKDVETPPFVFFGQGVVSDDSMKLKGLIHENSSKFYFWTGSNDYNMNISMKEYIEIIKKYVNRESKNEKK